MCFGNITRPMSDSSDRAPMKSWFVLCLRFVGSLILVSLLVSASAMYSTSDVSLWDREPALVQADVHRELSTNLAHANA